MGLPSLDISLKKQHLVLIIAVASLILIMTGAIPLSIVSNYQGPKPVFYGIYYNGKWYTPGSCEGSACIFDTSLEWDPDEKYGGMGNIAGEETTIFVPQQSLANSMPEWIPRSWTSDLAYIKNPIRAYEWDIKNEDGTITHYRMEEWVLKYYVTLSYEWDSNDEAGLKTLFPSDKRYHGVEVWLKIDLRPMWYFEKADKVYFGIAKIVVDKVKLSNILYDKERTEVSPVNVIRVNPMSAGSVLPIYLKPRSQEYRLQDPVVYKGQKLNPNIFAKEVYTRIILEDFGSRIGHPGLFQYVAYGDSVTYEFSIHAFVVGEWKVKDIDDLKDYEGRQSKVEDKPSLLDFLHLGAWGKILVPLALTAIILALLALFAPGVLALISTLARRASNKISRKRG